MSLVDDPRAPAPMTGFAYPSTSVNGTFLGLTVRQWYAGQALVGILANATSLANVKDRSEWCFRIADQMIAFEANEAVGVPTPQAGTPRRRRVP